MKKRMSKLITFADCQLPILRQAQDKLASYKLSIILTPRTTRPELFGACQLSQRGRRDAGA